MTTTSEADLSVQIRRLLLATARVEDAAVADLGWFLDRSQPARAATVVVSGLPSSELFAALQLRWKPLGGGSW